MQRLKQWLCSKGFHPYTKWEYLTPPFPPHIFEEGSDLFEMHLVRYKECQICGNNVYRLIIE